MDVRQRMSMVLVVLAVVLVSACGDESDRAGDSAPSSSSSSSSPPRSGNIGIARICVASEPEVCDRSAADLARRRPITAEQEAELAEVARRVSVVFPALPVAGQVCDEPPGPCTIRHAPIDEAYVDAARSAMAAAGHRDAVLRIARPDDPAPTGSLLYGVPVGAGCVVGYHGDRGGSHDEVGPLPDGGCVAP